MTHEYTYDVLDVDTHAAQDLHAATIVKEEIKKVLRCHGLIALADVLLIKKERSSNCRRR